MSKSLSGEEWKILHRRNARIKAQVPIAKPEDLANCYRFCCKVNARGERGKIVMWVGSGPASHLQKLGYTL